MNKELFWRVLLPRKAPHLPVMPLLRFKKFCLLYRCPVIKKTQPVQEASSGQSIGSGAHLFGSWLRATPASGPPSRWPSRPSSTTWRRCSADVSRPSPAGRWKRCRSPTPPRSCEQKQNPPTAKIKRSVLAESCKFKDLSSRQQIYILGTEFNKCTRVSNRCQQHRNDLKIPNQNFPAQMSLTW